MNGLTFKAPKGSIKKRRILGRGQGSGRGGTSGKGHKGQNSRSGGGVRPGFEGGQMPLFRRIARRGFSNYPFKEIYSVINIKDLEKVFQDNDVVSKATLVQKGLVTNNEMLIKILGDGELTKKLIIELLKVSKTAREKIEKAGGEIKAIEAKGKAKAKNVVKGKKEEAKTKKDKQKTE